MDVPLVREVESLAEVQERFCMKRYPQVTEGEWIQPRRKSYRII